MSDSPLPRSKKLHLSFASDKIICLLNLDSGQGWCKRALGLTDSYFYFPLLTSRTLGEDHKWVMGWNSLYQVGWTNSEDAKSLGRVSSTSAPSRPASIERARKCWLYDGSLANTWLFCRVKGLWKEPYLFHPYTLITHRRLSFLVITLIGSWERIVASQLHLRCIWGTEKS